MFRELGIKKFVDIGPTESQKRPKLDSSKPGLSASGMIADPPLGNSEPIRDLLRVQKRFSLAVRLRRTLWRERSV